MSFFLKRLDGGVYSGFAEIPSSKKSSLTNSKIVPIRTRWIESVHGKILFLKIFSDKELVVKGYEPDVASATYINLIISKLTIETLEILRSSALDLSNISLKEELKNFLSLCKDYAEKFEDLSHFKRNQKLSLPTFNIDYIDPNRTPKDFREELRKKELLKALEVVEPVVQPTTIKLAPLKNFLNEGDAIAITDSEATHVGILLEYHDPESLILMCTSNPNWNSFSRQADNEELSLLGFPIKKATYFAPVFRPNKMLSKLTSNAFSNRLDRLKKEFTNTTAYKVF